MIFNLWVKKKIANKSLHICFAYQYGLVLHFFLFLILIIIIVIMNYLLYEELFFPYKNGKQRNIIVIFHCKQ